MQSKIVLSMVIGILIIGVTQFVFAEELKTYIAVDKEQFEQPESKYNNQQITISGLVENYTRGLDITIIIKYPDKSQNEIITYATKKGEIYTLFQITNDSQIGTYTAVLKYNGVELASTSFEVLENQ
ncbi:MAG: hypothetical protein ACREAK_08965 [Nitrosarchaeum sp.]